MSTPEKFGSHHSAAAISDTEVAVRVNVAEIGRRHRLAVDVGLGAHFVGHDQHQSVDVGEAERPQVERIGEVEDDGVGRERHAERADDDHRQTRTLGEGSPRVPELPQPPGTERRGVFDLCDREAPAGGCHAREEAAQGEAHREWQRLTPVPAAARGDPAPGGHGSEFLAQIAGHGVAPFGIAHAQAQERFGKARRNGRRRHGCSSTASRPRDRFDSDACIALMALTPSGVTVK